MHVFLMWSGGLDSTALLYANLKLGHRVTTMEYTHNVDPHTADFYKTMSSVKIGAEMKAREVIREHLLKEFPSARWGREYAPIPTLINLDRLRFWTQPATHLYHAITRLGYEDVVQLGYVPGDSVCETFDGNPKPSMDYLHQIWDAYMRTTRDHRYPVPLRTPFLDPEDNPKIVGIVGNTKADFLARLPDYILDNFYTCESLEEHPDTRWCGSCTPCRTLFAALNKLTEEEVLENIRSSGIENNEQLTQYIKEGLESWRK